MKKLALVLAVVAFARAAQAGNLDGVFVSDQAAMMGGAVTALAASTTAVYYNPAGLAADTKHTSISLSTSSYGFSTRSSPSLAGTGADRSTDRLTTLQLLSVPAAIAYFKPLTPRLGAGFGLFVPLAVNEWQRDAATVGSTSATLENRLSANEYRLGGGVGYALTDTLRLGGALFVSYQTATVHYDFSSQQRTDDTVTSAAQLNINDELTRLSALATLGAQWQPTPEIIVGATWFLPQVQLTGSDRLSSQSTAFGPGTAFATNVFDTVSGSRGGGETRVALGVACSVERLRLACFTTGAATAMPTILPCSSSHRSPPATLTEPVQRRSSSSIPRAISKHAASTSA